MVTFMRNSLGEVVKHPNWPNPRALIDEPADCCCEDNNYDTVACDCCMHTGTVISGYRIKVEGIAELLCTDDSPDPDICSDVNGTYCVDGLTDLDPDGCDGTRDILVDLCLGPTPNLNYDIHEDPSDSGYCEMVVFVSAATGNAFGSIRWAKETLACADIAGPCVMDGFSNFTSGCDFSGCTLEVMGICEP